MRIINTLVLLTFTLTFFSCAHDITNSTKKTQAILDMKRATDFHSFSKPDEALVKHLEWDASVNFDERTIDATATYSITTSQDAERIILDIRELNISSVLVDGSEASYEIGDEMPFIGSPLSIDITPATKEISINYSTQPGADAFLWVEGDNPFLFTQSQAILARTWIPCQDSPGVRFTYNASVKVPSDLMALMSAENPTSKNEHGYYEFKMEQPIPSYLMALAVGDVEFRSVGEHTGVYATPDLIDAAEFEFSEMEDLLVARNYDADATNILNKRR